MAGNSPFGPIPLRAVGDARLSRLHMHALVLISYHDRMSLVTGKGQGCWTSNKTMAAKIGCNYANLSAAINELVKWGYLTANERQTADKRKRVYRVIFVDDGDEGSFSAGQTISHGDNLSGGQTTETVPTEASLPQGEQPEKVVCPDARQSDEIVCLDLPANPQKTANPAPQEIEEITLSVRDYGEPLKDSAEAARRNPARRAFQQGHNSNIGGTLAQWERDIKAMPMDCMDLGYFGLLDAARERYADDIELCGWIDRLRELLADRYEAALVDKCEAAVASSIPITRSCDRCSEPFEVTRPDRRFCTDRCQRAANKKALRRKQAQSKSAAAAVGAQL